MTHTLVAIYHFECMDCCLLVEIAAFRICFVEIICQLRCQFRIILNKKFYCAFTVIDATGCIDTRSCSKHEI